jgi:hypothetical protein
MPNPIKYSTGLETNALKKGNFYLGTGDVEKGPTSSTGYYNGINPPNGGYTVYVNKALDGPSIITPSSDAELIGLTNSIAGQSFTSATECLVYYASQNDKLICNIEYPQIITNGLVLNVDAGFSPSYPTSGVTWYDVSVSNINGTLINGPTFNTGSGGSIVFDGVDDYASIPYNTSLGLSSQGTLNVWCYPTTLTQRGFAGLVGMTVNGVSGGQSYYLHWRLFSNVISAGIQNGGTYNLISSPLPTSIAWYNFTFTWNGSFLNLYQNGISVATPVSQTISAQLLNTQVDIGGNMFRVDAGIQGFFTGFIPITQIYNRGLTAQEVLQNYNATKSRFGL